MKSPSGLHSLRPRLRQWLSLDSSRKLHKRPIQDERSPSSLSISTATTSDGEYIEDKSLFSCRPKLPESPPGCNFSRPGSSRSIKDSVLDNKALAKECQLLPQTPTPTVRSIEAPPIPRYILPIDPKWHKRDICTTQEVTALPKFSCSPTPRPKTSNSTSRDQNQTTAKQVNDEAHVRAQLEMVKVQLFDSRMQLAVWDEQIRDLNTKLDHLLKSNVHNSTKRRDLALKANRASWKLAAKERSLLDKERLIDQLLKEKTALEKQSRVNDLVRQTMWMEIEKVKRKSAPQPSATRPSVPAWWV